MSKALFDIGASSTIAAALIAGHAVALSIDLSDDVDPNFIEHLVANGRLSIATNPNFDAMTADAIIPVVGFSIVEPDFVVPAAKDVEASIPEGNEVEHQAAASEPAPEAEADVQTASDSAAAPEADAQA